MNQNQTSVENKVIYNLKDLEKIFPFGRSKLLKLCKDGTLPVIKIGRDYISFPTLIERWMKENEEKKSFFK